MQRIFQGKEGGFDLVRIQIHLRTHQRIGQIARVVVAAHAG